MSDNELRGIVLKTFYDQRRRGHDMWENADCPSGIDSSEFFRIAEQLADYGLVRWEPRNAIGVSRYSLGGMGKISASGVDVIEGTAQSPISIKIDRVDTLHTGNPVSVNNSSNVQVGSNNAINTTIDLSKVLKAIESAEASDGEKEQAKSQWKAALEHPLTSAVVGLIPSAIELFKK